MKCKWAVMSTIPVTWGEHFHSQPYCPILLPSFHQCVPDGQAPVPGWAWDWQDLAPVLRGTQWAARVALHDWPQGQDSDSDLGLTGPLITPNPKRKLTGKFNNREEVCVFGCLCACEGLYPYMLVLSTQCYFDEGELQAYWHHWHHQTGFCVT